MCVQTKIGGYTEGEIDGGQEGGREGGRKREEKKGGGSREQEN